MADQPTPAADEEQFYDDVIAPALADIAALCVARRIPFLALVQFGVEKDGSGAYGETAAGPELSKGIVAASNARHRTDGGPYLTGWAMTARGGAGNA